MYEILVSGMTCNGCAKSINNAVKAKDNLAAIEIDLLTQKILIKTSKRLDEIVSVIENTGFSVLNKKEVN